MNRREFISGALACGAASRFQLPLAHGAGYHGKLFVFIQADGGWDPTSFCDPKTNVPGEAVINHWARGNEVRQAGNLRYAPFASNAAFFEKYHDRMLVINGVDAQTNSHAAGIVHNWSGQLAEGYPTTTAILAAHNGGGMSMPYLSFGGFSNPAGLAVYTRLDDATVVRSIAAPDLPAGPATAPFIKSEDWESIRAARSSSSVRIASAPNLLPRAARNRRLYAAAVTPEATGGLREFASAIPTPGELKGIEKLGNLWSTLKRQCQLAVLAFKARVAVSADLYLGGFDTHSNHDADHNWLLGNLTDSVDFLWDYAELHGVADRLVVVMGSDFGRTNFYNDAEGKDHWPIGSFIVMEKNQPWTDRAVGETDALHFAHRINPSTLQRDDHSGALIHPRHVHKALRRYLGVEASEGSRRFPFHRTEDFLLFG